MQQHDTEQSSRRAKTGRPKLNPKATGVYIGGTSPSTLAKWRMTGKGPPFSKVGPRLVVYDPDDLDDYVAARRRRSTADPGDPGVGR